MVFVLECCITTENTRLVGLIRSHQKTKKKFGIQDAYKLIYQSVFGVAHILDNPDRAKKYLEQEMMTVPASDHLPLIENISISGDIVRINLQPYKFYGGNTDLLFEAMVASAREINGTQQEFLELWDEFKHAVLNSSLNFDKQELIDFDVKVKSENYPARHHSSDYREANQPAYRVLKRSVALIPSLRAMESVLV